MIKLLASLLLGLSFTTPINYEEVTEEVSVEVSESVEPTVEPTAEPSEVPTADPYVSTTYTYQDEYGSMTITTVSDTECNVEIVYEGETTSYVAFYSIHEGTLRIASKETLNSMDFEIGEENAIVPVQEEEIPEVDEEPEIVYPCNVVINVSNINYGDVLADLEGGEVGQVVTLRVAPNVLCKVVNVTANGVQLVKNETGNYTFALVEGNNTVSVEFAVDNEQLTYLADQIGNIKNGNWEDIFSVNNLLNFISWAITLLLSSGFFVTLIKNKKIKSKTADEIAEAVKLANETSIVETVNKVLEKVLGDSYYTYLEKTDSIDETMKVLTRCFVLSQENTPEARLAIIQELTNLKTNQNELTEKVKALINAEIQKNNAENAEKLKAIQALKEANNKINTNNSGGDTYGQI